MKAKVIYDGMINMELDRDIKAAFSVHGYKSTGSGQTMIEPYQRDLGFELTASPCKQMDCIWNEEDSGCNTTYDSAPCKRNRKARTEPQQPTQGLVAPVVSPPSTQIFKSCKLCGRELNSLGFCPNCIN